MISELKVHPGDQRNRQWFQIVAILIACISSLNFGLSFGWTSPSIPNLLSSNSTIKISFEECSYFPIIQSLCLMGTCPIVAILVEILGRKRCALLLSVPYLISWILIATANSTLMLNLSRLFAGIGDSSVFTVLPMYVGEIAEPNVRGLWGNMVGIGVYLGQFIINVIGAFMSIPHTAIVCALGPTLHLILFSFMPESPYFLLMKGREEAARKSLQTLRWKKDVDEEFIKLESDVKRQISEKGTLRDLFVKSVNRRALIVGCGLRAAQQFSGMPAFGVYTQYMFEQSGSVFSKSTSSIIYTGALLLIMSSNMFLMDRYGRRLSMMLSSIGCGLTLLVLAAFCYVADNELVDVSSVRWIPLLGMVIWLLFAGSGLGLVPILMLGELFSASVKGKAINVVCIFFAASFLTSTKVFQTLANNFGLFAPFTFFGLCCVVILIFSYTCVPETKGKTLEEIQQMLRRTK